MERLTVEDMKGIELELMDELDRICREHDAKYFLGYGSLLGAVRHGGFIPWDDDMDVVMLREDYERFMAGFDEWCQVDRYKLISYRDGESIFPFAKMTDSSTKVYENFIEKSRSNGVWIDIFPLDYVDPSNKASFKRAFSANARTGLLRSFILADPSVGSSAIVKLAKRVVCPFVKGLDPVKYSRRLDENARGACAHESDLVADFLGEGKPEKLFPIELFEPIEMPFEDRVFYAPKGYEEYLTIEYGDWQTPPPEDSRPIHTCEAYRL